MFDFPWFWTLVGLALFLGVGRRAGGDAFVLGQLDRAVGWARGGSGHCPHEGCYAVVAHPIYVCPRCGRGHPILRPTREALFWSPCPCGQRLPTLFWLGKGDLARRCPFCQGSLPDRNAEAAHIPIYGGASAGKTMFWASATWSLLERPWRGSTARLFPPSRHDGFVKRARARFEAGRVEAKTAEVAPAASTIVLSQGADTTPVHLYDSAGEAGDSEAQLLEAHDFLGHITGLIIVVDALSLGSLKERYEAAGGADRSATTSGVPAEKTVTRLINVLRPLYAPTPRARISRPVAVVLTKVDLPGLTDALGVALGGADDPAPPRASAGADDPAPPRASAGADDSARLRAWLGRHEPHLAGLLDSHFSNVRFFAVSALGHDDIGRRAFAPKGVLTPLAWLLAPLLSRRRRLTTRLARTVTEGAVAAAVIATLVLTPLVAVAVGSYHRATGALAARRKAAHERARAAAWARAAAQAADHKLDRTAREQALIAFLADYPVNPYARLAREHLEDLQLGLEPVMARVQLGNLSRFGFALDKTEVTVAAYRACVERGPCRRDSFLTNSDNRYCNWGHADRDHHPMNCVDWFGARTFCLARGKRLPKGREWEMANTLSLLGGMPHSLVPTCAVAVLNDGATTGTVGYSTAGCGRGSTWPVGSKPLPADGFGLFDMTGNVSEWTFDWFLPGTQRTIWGGAWTDPPEAVRPARRWGVDPQAKDARIGFRCARS